MTVTKDVLGIILLNVPSSLSRPTWERCGLCFHGGSQCAMDEGAWLLLRSAHDKLEHWMQFFFCEVRVLAGRLSWLRRFITRPG